MKTFEVSFYIFGGFIIISAIIGLIIMIRRIKNGCENDKKDCFFFIPIVSLVITLYGIIFAIADNYFSQFDYQPRSILEYEELNEKGISYDSCLDNKTQTSPKYIFVLDVSKSTKKISVEMTSTIQEQIDAINQSGRLGTNKETFGVDYNRNTIPFSDLLKVRLLYSLIQLNNKNYDTIDYTIIYFAEVCEKENHSLGKTLSDCIDISFKNIKYKEIDGQNSDFVSLFGFINKQIQSYPLRTPLEKKDVNIVFLTDYLHDVPNANRYETKINLEESIKQLENPNTFLTLFMVEDDPIFINNGDNNKDIKLTRIYNLLQKNLQESTFQNIDLRNYDFTFDCPLIQSKPLPFFYSKSIFAESLKTTMVFSHEHDLGIRVGNYSNSDRREYRLYQSSREKPCRLSNNKTPITVGKNEKVVFEIFGYIPAPYTAPDIIIEDRSKGVQYVLPIVFFKKCPESVVILSWVIIIVLIVGLINIAICVVRCRKNKINNLDNNIEKKETISQVSEYNISIK